MKNIRSILRLTLLAIPLAAHSGPAPTSTAGSAAENPALAKFSDNVTLYMSFSNGPDADVAKGNPSPKKMDGTADLAPGLYGKALLFRPEPSPDGAIKCMAYDTSDNIDLRKPGSLAIWISSKDWVRGPEEEYFWPVKIMVNGAQIMLGRQGQAPQRNDSVYLWAKTGDTSEVIAEAGNSLDWQNGQWHLMVVNWGPDWVEFSLDGNTLVRKELPSPFPQDTDGKGNLLLAVQTPKCQYLVDELMVLDRPLEFDEIQWLYNQGTEAANAIHP